MHDLTGAEMEISISWHGDNFNVELASKAGKDAFLSIRGCRVVNGSNGPFVSYPPKKNEQTGKYWNHVYGSEKFNAVVLEKAQASQQPAKQPRMATDEDIPF
jgi:DNA-binding cell septation regulator SpoVG